MAMKGKENGVNENQGPIMCLSACLLIHPIYLPTYLPGELR